MALVSAGLNEQEIIRFTDYTPYEISEALSRDFLSWTAINNAKRAKSTAQDAMAGFDPELVAKAHGVCRKTALKDLAELADRIIIRQQLPSMVDRMTGLPLDLTHSHAVEHVRACLHSQYCGPFKRGTSHSTIDKQIRLVMLESGVRYTTEKPRLRPIKAI